MNKMIYSLLCVAALTSCAGQYNIEGTSNVTTLDGQMLYLKVISENELKNLDSCDVVHGQFHFSGALDAEQMASIYMDNRSVMPVVLENGDITIKINNTQQVVSGTPLNDTLFKFMRQYDQLRNEAVELDHKEARAIMDGLDMNEVTRELQAQALLINDELDRLITGFITSNFDNVLGPGVFMMVTSGQMPELTPWIEDIMSKATERFKNDPYVRDFYEAAQHNQAVMNGMVDGNVNVNANANANVNVNVNEAPTPNDMAQPADSAE